MCEVEHGMQARRISLRACLLCVSSMIHVSGHAASGSAPQQAPGSSGYVLRQDVQEVLLYATALDHRGQPVLNLEKNNVKVSEDNIPVVLTSFSRNDVPVSLSLVLDESSSMSDKRPAIAEAAIKLIQSSNPEDEVAVTNFADTAYLDQDFTNDKAKLDTALHKNTTASGGTALFDTMIQAADHLTQKAHRSKEVIVVVTDGRDNASATDLAAAVRRVQTANGPVIYAIGLLYGVPGSDAKRARRDLQSLADETGGIAFFPSSVQEVGQIAEQVAKDIRNQYTLTYHPRRSSTEQNYRTIKVEAKGADGERLQVRARKGYLYATRLHP